ncbi:glycoside hydrolase N-terminal domain-containing protein [Nonomuraea sp. NPDC052634]|uniref:glycoside hydrolase N-terminal domain-containing protein n=1 Tax=Nonomuraea sp. NPDC052634 TaxID=3155813 RepID=UPI0034269035
MSFTLRHTSPRDDKTVTAHNGRLTIRGRLADNGLRFEAQLQVITQGGRRTGEGQSVRVEGADSAVLLLSAGTDYADTYPTYRRDDPTTASPRPSTPPPAPATATHCATRRPPRHRPHRARRHRRPRHPAAALRRRPERRSAPDRRPGPARHHRPRPDRRGGENQARPRLLTPKTPGASLVSSAGRSAGS